MWHESHESGQWKLGICAGVPGTRQAYVAARVRARVMSEWIKRSQEHVASRRSQNEEAIFPTRTRPSRPPRRLAIISRKTDGRQQALHRTSMTGKGTAHLSAAAAFFTKFREQRFLHLGARRFGRGRGHGGVGAPPLRGCGGPPGALKTRTQNGFIFGLDECDRVFGPHRPGLRPVTLAATV